MNMTWLTFESMKRSISSLSVTTIHQDDEFHDIALDIAS